MPDTDEMTRTHSWPLYRGTKELKAKPMTKAEYCGLRNWRVPADEDPNERGYVVEYQDGGKPNLEGYDGYVSWSPADVFERAYRPCETYVDRMKIEWDELHERIGKLTRFMQTDQFRGLSEAERFWMNKQLNAMTEYRDALGRRHLVATGEGQPA